MGKSEWSEQQSPHAIHKREREREREEERERESGRWGGGKTPYPFNGLFFLWGDLDEARAASPSLLFLTTTPLSACLSGVRLIQHLHKPLLVSTDKLQPQQSKINK